MPALQTPSLSGPALGHINLMLDTFIANASVDDLRAITRNLLATHPSCLTQSYKTCARDRLCRADNAAELLSATLFKQVDSFYLPTQSLYDLLSHTRKLYGVGFGSSSLPLLTEIVRSTIGIRWRERSNTAELLAIVDNDISQAIQSTKEEILSGSIKDIARVRDAAERLKLAVVDSKNDVLIWNGRFPFDMEIRPPVLALGPNEINGGLIAIHLVMTTGDLDA